MWFVFIGYVFRFYRLYSSHSHPMRFAFIGYLVRTHTLCGSHSQVMWFVFIRYLVRIYRVYSSHSKAMRLAVIGYMVRIDRLCGLLLQTMWFAFITKYSSNVKNQLYNHTITWEFQFQVFTIWFTRFESDIGGSLTLWDKGHSTTWSCWVEHY